MYFVQPQSDKKVVSGDYRQMIKSLRKTTPSLWDPDITMVIILDGSSSTLNALRTCEVNGHYVREDSQIRH